MKPATAADPTVAKCLIKNNCNCFSQESIVFVAVIKGMKVVKNDLLFREQ